MSNDFFIFIFYTRYNKICYCAIVHKRRINKFVFISTISYKANKVTSIIIQTIHRRDGRVRHNPLVYIHLLCYIRYNMNYIIPSLPVK